VFLFRDDGDRARHCSQCHSVTSAEARASAATNESLETQSLIKCVSLCIIKAIERIYDPKMAPQLRSRRPDTLIETVSACSSERDWSKWGRTYVTTRTALALDKADHTCDPYSRAENTMDTLVE
jgi:hypothetical protein